MYSVCSLKNVKVPELITEHVPTHRESLLDSVYLLLSITSNNV